MANPVAAIEQAGVYVEKQSEAQVIAAIKRAGKAARLSVNRRLKDAGAVVVMEIGKRTPRGATGLLKRSTKATGSAATLSVRIVNTAIASSPRYPKFRYGKRLEFDPIYGGRYKFFYPGFEAKKEEAIAQVRKVLDDVGNEFMAGGV
jgi:hypothetical protein